MKSNKIQLFCKRCGKDFWLWPSQMKKSGGKFCSLKCKRPKKIKKICPRCNKEFWIPPSSVKTNRGKFCSFGCKYPKRIKKICQTCNKEFWVSPNKLRNGFSKYCCFKCYGLSMVGKMGQESPGWEGGKIKKLCKICGKEFYIHLHGIKVNCSKECGAKAQSEKTRRENSSFWKGGITPLHMAIRYSTEGRKWTRDILVRDNYTCQECNTKGCYLEAHHIEKFNILLKKFLNQYSQFSPIEDKETLIRLATTHEPFWNLDNGKTLCLKCHIKTRKEVKQGG